ncbi:MAG: hypothetical protein CL676_01165 [Bdellovibrionaceae bacterium]|nr:hypothetical protein [Pseudobdellovibrionaceae bacterium]|tara:strand:+ start:2073 stop:2750 length:678 start_codon:yes stop_codon:yes gene_type:complete
MFDIFFVSYRESNADKNWVDLKARFPEAQRIHGVRGIYNAYGEAAKQAKTPYFFTVDGDNRIVSSFDFSTKNLKLDFETVHVWRCFNPAINMAYGFGAVKLFPKDLFQDSDLNGVDVTSSLAGKYKIINEMASETYFFDSPLEAWRGAFRECAKLKAGVIKNQRNEETVHRLDQWIKFRSPLANEKWIRRGAEDGMKYAQESPTLDWINDFEKLDSFFEKAYFND